MDERIVVKNFSLKTPLPQGEKVWVRENPQVRRRGISSIRDKEKLVIKIKKTAPGADIIPKLEYIRTPSADYERNIRNWLLKRC